MVMLHKGSNRRKVSGLDIEVWKGKSRVIFSEHKRGILGSLGF